MDIHKDLQKAKVQGEPVDIQLAGGEVLKDVFVETIRDTSFDVVLWNRGRAEKRKVLVQFEDGERLTPGGELSEGEQDAEGE
jgi:hypothetical protein